ncbi:hypothetical protein [Ilumatobacter sp.]|uniref:hypothetical protein n=1 Tax=Ilumatobacter sp. TaxID=1967498 RepID=UPI003C6111D7
MQRRGPARHLLVLVAAFVVLLGPLAPSTVSASPATAAVIVTTPAVIAVDAAGAGDPPPVTVSDFFPEENNLTDCLGLVERPGCGSEERGGWAQNVIFVLLVLGLGFIFWRVFVGVRRNRAD